MTDPNPYQPPSTSVEDISPSAVLGLPELAGRGTRLGAVLLDIFIAGGLAGIAAAIAIPILLVGRHNGSSTTAMIILVCCLVPAVLIPWIVNLVWLHKYGQTIGKRICGIKILRRDGSRAGLGRIFWLRMVIPGVLGAIPYLGTLFSLTDACFIFRQDKRCIHDHIADTAVFIA